MRGFLYLHLTSGGFLKLRKYFCNYATGGFCNLPILDCGQVRGSCSFVFFRDMNFILAAGQMEPKLQWITSF